MTREELLAGVLDTLQSIAPEVDLAALRRDAPLRDQVDLDSLDWLHVIVGLQQRFGVTIAEADYARLDTLDHLVDHLAAQR